MSAYYQKFLKAGIDLAPLGVCENNMADLYSCTPKGARVFGTARVDGIHYCFVRGFDQMVFAVNPMNDGGDCVHPLAADFKQFLQMLLAAGSADALEQAHAWTRQDFEEYLKYTERSPEQEAALEELGSKLGLRPLEDPYGTLKDLQAGFDYARIPFRKDYYEEYLPPLPQPPEIPEWKIHYQGGFWSSVDGERPGQEIRLDAALGWGADWVMPAIYLCSKGLCVLAARCADDEAVRAWQDRWMQVILENGGDLTRAQEMQMEAENPIAIQLEGEAVVNGKRLYWESSCGIQWNPNLEEGEENSPMAASALRHFGFDEDCGWGFQLLCFPWATKRRPKWHGCTIHLRQADVRLPGPQFTAEQPGQQVQFTHPGTESTHTLTVQGFEPETVDPVIFRDRSRIYPDKVLTMSYTIDPPLEGKYFWLQDTAPGDAPKYRPRKDIPAEQKPAYLPEAKNDVMVAQLDERYGLEKPGPESVGIIGGADGPTAILMARTDPDAGEDVRSQCSSLHFDPVDKVTWQIVFNVIDPRTCTVEIEPEA